MSEIFFFKSRLWDSHCERMASSAGHLLEMTLLVFSGYKKKTIKQMDGFCDVKNVSKINFCTFNVKITTYAMLLKTKVTYVREKR